MSRRWLLVVTSFVLCQTFVSVGGRPRIDRSLAVWELVWQKGQLVLAARRPVQPTRLSPADVGFDERVAAEFVPFANEPDAAGPSERNYVAPRPRRLAAAQKRSRNRRPMARLQKTAQIHRMHPKTTQPNGTQRYNATGQTMRPNNSRQLNVSAPTATPSVSTELDK